MSELPVFDTLGTIAEVSVAFLGFTGVVGVFADFERSRSSVSLRLWVMVGLAFATLLLAVLPSVLHHLGVSGPVLWAFCSAGIVAVCLAQFVFVVPRALVEQRAGRWAQPLIFRLFPVLVVGCFLTQGLNMLGIGFERTAGAYVLGLFLMLIANGLNFIALLVDLRSDDGSDPVSSPTLSSSNPEP